MFGLKPKFFVGWSMLNQSLCVNDVKQWFCMVIQVGLQKSEQAFDKPAVKSLNFMERLAVWSLSKPVSSTAHLSISSYSWPYLDKINVQII